MMMTRCLISLGGNLGVTPELFGDALRRMESMGLPTVAISTPLRTRPVGADAGTEFLNAAAVLQSPLPAAETLGTLHQIEGEFGRVRTLHWGPRTLDLDLLLYGDEVIDSERLVIPHPAMWYRRFVLDPAVQIAADWVHPLLQKSLLHLHRRLLVQPLLLEIAEHRAPNSTAQAEQLPASEACSAVIQQVSRLLIPHGIAASVEWQDAPSPDFEQTSRPPDEAAPRDSDQRPHDEPATSRRLADEVSSLASPRGQVTLRNVSEFAARDPHSAARVVLHANNTVNPGRADRTQPSHASPFEIHVWRPVSSADESYEDAAAAQKSERPGQVDFAAQTIEHLVLAMLG